MRFIVISMLFVGFGCTSSTPLLPKERTGEVAVAPILPIDGQLVYKGFGEYFEDRFTGYHVAVDLEAPADTPVYAVEEGEVTYSGWVSGYGGVMVVKIIMSDLSPIARTDVRATGDRTPSYIYGHLDPASMRVVGESVGEGEQIAFLGEKGEETDGEREHLHFAMYEGEEVRLNGYETSAAAVGEWLNPTDYVRLAPIARRATGGRTKSFVHRQT